jgi:hypothetical protein
MELLTRFARRAFFPNPTRDVGTTILIEEPPPKSNNLLPLLVIGGLGVLLLTRK